MSHLQPEAEESSGQERCVVVWQQPCEPHAHLRAAGFHPPSHPIPSHPNSPHRRPIPSYPIPSQDFMNESHVHGFVNRLKRTIITIDERMAVHALVEYVPGYAVAHQLSMCEAKERRESEQQPSWLLMSPNHWSALLFYTPRRNKLSVMELDAVSGRRVRCVVHTSYPVHADATHTLCGETLGFSGGCFASC